MEKNCSPPYRPPPLPLLHPTINHPPSLKLLPNNEDKFLCEFIPFVLEDFNEIPFDKKNKKGKEAASRYGIYSANMEHQWQWRKEIKSIFCSLFMLPIRLFFVSFLFRLKLDNCRIMSLKLWPGIAPLPPRPGLPVFTQTPSNRNHCQAIRIIRLKQKTSCSNPIGLELIKFQIPKNVERKNFH